MCVCLCVSGFPFVCWIRFCSDGRTENRESPLWGLRSFFRCFSLLQPPFWLYPEVGTGCSVAAQLVLVLSARNFLRIIPDAERVFWTIWFRIVSLEFLFLTPSDSSLSTVPKSVFICRWMTKILFPHFPRFLLSKILFSCSYPRMFCRYSVCLIRPDIVLKST